MAPIGNLVCEGDLDAMKRRGWIERAREPIPHEGRILVTLCHPHQTVGEGCDRCYTAVETFRSLPLDDSGPSQLAVGGEVDQAFAGQRRISDLATCETPALRDAGPAFVLARVRAVVRLS